MSGQVPIVIDGAELSVPEGRTILEAAEGAGIYIPRLCYHPELVPHGSCRVCTVLVNGRPQAACTTPVAGGMVIESSSERLLELRRRLIEMLFVEGNHFCMFCERSGNCELQALAYRFGIAAPRYPFLFPKRALDATHPDAMIDHNRCVLCARCLRASRDLDRKHALGFVGRGPGKRLAPSAQGGLAGTGLQVQDKALDVCPVGSLLRKRVGYAVPVGERTYDHRPIGSDVESRGAVSSK